MALSSEYLNAGNLVLGYCTTQNETFGSPGAGTYPSGTILSRSGGYVVPYVRGGAVPIGVLLADVVATGVGPFPCSMIASGLVRADQLLIQDGTAVGWQEYDLLRSLRIVPNRALDLRPITPDVDPGAVLLANALGYWDVQAAGALTTVDTTVSQDLTTWTKNATVTAGQADPDGGTAAYLVSSSITDAYLRPASDTAKCFGYVRASCKIKVLEPTTATSIQFMGEPNGVYLTAPKASAETAARDNVIPYSTADISPLGWRYEDIGGGWRYLEIEAIPRSGNIALAKQHPAFRFLQASAVATDVCHIYDVQLFHRRVSAVADRNGGTALVQATADDRPSLMDTGVMGRPAIVGAYNRRQTVTAARAVGSGSWALALTGVSVCMEFPGSEDIATVTGTTGSAAITCIGGTAVARGTWGWRWTTDAGVTTSGSFGGKVTTTPVSLVLRYDGTALRLYVDGQQVGSDAVVTAAGTMTGTGVAFGSSISETAAVSMAVFAGDYTDTQIAQIALRLRSLAGFPARWAVDLWSGQSNAVNLDSSPRRGYQGARFTAGPAIACHDRDGSGNYNPVPLIAAARPYWVKYLDRRAVAGGPARGYQRAATRNGVHGRIVASMCKGGTGIASWLTPGQELYDHLRVAWPAALADAGTHLVEPGDIVWIQGEADTADPTDYRTKLAEFAAETRAMMGTNARMVLHRLSTGYVGSYPANNDALRAEQDAFLSADGNAVVCHGDYPVGDHFDGIHYSTHGAACHGENAFLEPRGLTPITDPSTVP